MVALSGCIASIDAVVSVTRVDDHLFADVMTCWDSETDGLRLELDKKWFFEGSVASWEFPRTNRTTVDLGAVNELAELIGDRPMTLVPEGVDNPVWVPSFTGDQLRSLPEGTYLVAKSGSETGLVVASMYETYADPYCGGDNDRDG